MRFRCTGTERYQGFAVIPFIVLYLMMAGIACWLPAPAGLGIRWFGFRYFQASLALIVLLYIGNVILDIPLSSLSVIVGVLAVVGGGLAVFRHRRDLTSLRFALVHPVWVLFVLVAIIALARGGVSYLPYPGDEIASWLRLARQIFLVDAYWSNLVDYHHGGYTNGWPLLLAFANAIAGTWDDGHAALIPFLLHIGLLGLAYDVLRNRAAIAFQRTSDATLLAWLGVLGLLAIEASWVLVPRFLLIDEPLNYVFIGAFLIAIVALTAEPPSERTIAHLGLTVAAGYLIKIAMLAIIPALLIIAVADAWGTRSRWRTALRDALWLVLPLAAVMVTWSQIRTAHECNASPLKLLGEFGAPTAERLLFVGDLYLKVLLDYVPHYKVPISLGALVCLGLACLHRRFLWVVLAIAAFVAAYSLALYLSYVSCLDIIDSAELQSFQRYFLTNLRIIHFVGPILLALLVLGDLRSKGILTRILDARHARAGAVVAIALLAGYQAWMADRSLQDLATRNLQDEKVRASILRMKDEAGALRELIARRGMVEPRVSVIDQGGYNVEFELASYFGIKDRPDAKSNFVYMPVGPYSWGAERFNFATSVTDLAGLVGWWRGFDIVWPVNLDDFAREAIGRIVTDHACRAQPERYFLVRRSDGFFECSAKNR